MLYFLMIYNSDNLSLSHVFCKAFKSFARKTAHRVFNHYVDIDVYQQYMFSILLHPITFMLGTAVYKAVISTVFDDFHEFFVCF